MPVRINVGITNARLRSALDRLGAERVPTLDIRFHVVDTLAEDIRAGETGWPVDTGFSRDSFFTDGSYLMNHADYAIYVRTGLRALRTYVRNNLVRLVELALNIIGFQRAARLAPGALMAAELLLGAGLDVFLPDVIPSQLRQLRRIQRLAGSGVSLRSATRPLCYRSREIRVYSGAT